MRPVQEMAVAASDDELNQDMMRIVSGLGLRVCRCFEGILVTLNPEAQIDRKAQG